MTIIIIQLSTKSYAYFYILITYLQKCHNQVEIEISLWIQLSQGIQAYALYCNSYLGVAGDDDLLDSVAGDSDLRTGVPKAQAVTGVNDRFSFFDFSGYNIRQNNSTSDG